MGLEKVSEYFNEDCGVFVEKFKSKDSLKFPAFAEVWQEMKFSFIFVPWKYLGEMQEIVEEYLKVCKMIWLKSETVEERVCGLYLLRAIYLKQPASQYVKINLSHEDWQLMKQFLYVIKDFEQNETRYILQELFSLNAFTIGVPDCNPAKGKRVGGLLESTVAQFSGGNASYSEMISALGRETKEYNEERMACLKVYPKLHSYPSVETDSLVEQLMGGLKVFEQEVDKIRKESLHENVTPGSSVREYETVREETEERISMKRKKRHGACSESDESSDSGEDSANLDMPQLVYSDSDAGTEDEGSFGISSNLPESGAEVHLSDFELTSSEDEDSSIGCSGSGLDIQEAQKSPRQCATPRRGRRRNTKSNH